MTSTPPTDVFVVAPSIPHNREAEEAVVGAVLINPDVFHPCRLQLVDGTTEFYIQRHGFIWNAFQYLSEKRIPIDLLTVSEELDRKGMLAEIGGPAYLTSLVNQVPSTLNAESYAEIVHSHYVRRKIIAAANSIAECGYDESMEIQQSASRATRALSQAVNLANSGRLVSMSESIKQTDAMIETNEKSEIMPGIPTPLLDLNSLLGGGGQKGDLNLISARPGWGKTSLLMQIARYGAKYPAKERVERKHVAVFSMEMGHKQLSMRMISQMTGIDYQYLRAGKILPEKKADYYEAIGELGTLDIYIDDTPGVSGDYIMSRCEILASAGELDMVCVDSLNLMRSGMNFKRSDIEVDYNATMLKNIAREFDIPVWAAHQMNRGIESRGGDSKPQLSDLREGGEQPSDTVIFIYHKEDPDTRELKDSSLIVAKQRNGPTGDVPTVFLPHLTMFGNAARIKF